MTPADAIISPGAGGAQVFLDPQRTACPPSSYVSADSYLQLDVWNSVPGAFVNFHIFSMDAQGRVVRTTYTATPTSDRTDNVFTYPLTEGFLMSISFVRNFVAATGSTFVRLTLLLGSPTPKTFMQILCQGYLDLGNRLSWPNGTLLRSYDGLGVMRSVTGTTPGAGAEISETVPSGALWRLVVFNYGLTTSATVANRGSGFVIDDGSHILLNYPAINNSVASTTYGFNALAGSNLSYGANFPMNWPIPQQMWLAAGYRIRTLTTLLQAGDQYTAPQYQVEEFIAP